MSVELQEKQGVRLAIEGCGHGTLDAIYSSIADACRLKGWPGVDLLIIGGDFQAVRNAYDLNCVSMPAKYRAMGDFHKYYSGDRIAPYLTIFVGGNHEASNYLFELYYGGWVAPNIYYMGAANVLRLGPLRIAGMSGIWKGFDYREPHKERLPYNGSDMKSIYHTRELDVRKLLQIRTQVDIGISHDWPQGVEWKGDWKNLFASKRYFKDDAESGRLGSEAAKYVMGWLRPSYWFSAHLHCKYAAVVEHDEPETTKHRISHSQPPKNESEIVLEGADTATVVTNQDELDLDVEGGEISKPDQVDANSQTRANPNEINVELEYDDPDIYNPEGPSETSNNGGTNGHVYGPFSSSEEARAALPDSFRRPAPQKPVEPVVHPPGIANTTTRFLALDKCLPRNDFLQLMEIPTEDQIELTRPLKLEYDREWLAITRSTALDEPVVVGDPSHSVPIAKNQAGYYELIDKRRMWIDEHIGDADLIIPENFQAIAPVYDGGNWEQQPYSSVKNIIEYPNPQTQAYCDLLQVPNPLGLSEKERDLRMEKGPRPDPQSEQFDGRRGRGGFENRGRGGTGYRGRGSFGNRRPGLHGDRGSGGFGHRGRDGIRGWGRGDGHG